MAEPARVGPLAAFARPERGVPGPEPIVLRALPFQGKLILRGADDVRAKASAVLGLELPGTLRMASGDGVQALWLGPDEWLFLVAAEAVEARASVLREALGGMGHALVVLSDRFAGIAIEGARAPDVLNAGCALDLHPLTFPAGMVTRTLLGKAPIVLLRPERPDRFELLVNGSFAPYAWLFLENAAREFGYGVAA